MKKKYKLTDEIIVFCDTKLYRIEALKDFSDIKKGDKGGFIESENNLSHNGNCWIYDDAKVCDEAKVYGNAMIYGHALICGYAKVYDNAQAYDNAEVCDHAKVYYKAKVCDKARINDNAEVYGQALVCDNARIYDNVNIYGNAEVYGNVRICGDAKIENKSDYITFKNWWSSGRYFTWTRSNNMWTVGCFYGTGKELIEKAYKDSELSGREYERVVNYVESILKEN